MILVISSSQDLHANSVLGGLARRGVKATLLDTSKFPQRLRLSINYGGSDGNDHYIRDDSNAELALSDFRVVWWRRPQPFELHPEITSPAYQAVAHAESHEAFWGLWLAVDAFWVNLPTRDQDAAHKVYQLRAAREVGLETPVTLVTNDP